MLGIYGTLLLISILLIESVRTLKYTTTCLHGLKSCSCAAILQYSRGKWRVDFKDRKRAYPRAEWTNFICNGVMLFRETYQS